MSTGLGLDVLPTDGALGGPPLHYFWAQLPIFRVPVARPRGGDLDFEKLTIVLTFLRLKFVQ